MKLENRIRELIAVGASITANCQPCLQYHTRKAVEFGADGQEIAEAIEMGKLVRKGAAAKMDTFSSGIGVTVPPPTREEEKASGCCS